jgi:hypothetical protein
VRQPRRLDGESRRVGCGGTPQQAPAEAGLRSNRPEQLGPLDHPDLRKEPLLHGVKVSGRRFRCSGLQRDAGIIPQHLPGRDRRGQRCQARLQVRQAWRGGAGGLPGHTTRLGQPLALGLPRGRSDQHLVATAIGEARRHPDGSMAERLTQGQDGRRLEGPQGPWAGAAFDEVRPTWGQAGMEMVRQPTTPAGIELPESYQGREPGRIHRTVAGETHERSEAWADVPRCLPERPPYRGRPTREKCVFRRHERQECSSEGPVRKRVMAQHTPARTSRRAKGPRPPPCGIPPIPGRAGVQLRDEPIGQRQDHLGGRPYGQTQATPHLQRAAWCSQGLNTRRAPASPLARLAALPCETPGVKGIRLARQGLQIPDLLPLLPPPLALPSWGLRSPREGRGATAVGPAQRAVPLVTHVRRDLSGDRGTHGLCRLSVGGPRQVPQPTVGGEQAPPLVHPSFRNLHQPLEGHRVVGFASPMAPQHSLSPVGERTKAHPLCGPPVVFAARLAAAIQVAARGPLWRYPETQMLMPRLPHRLRPPRAGSPRAPGHLAKPELQGGRSPVLLPMPRENGLTLVGCTGEKVPDLKRRQIRRKGSQPAERALPVWPGATPR